MLLVTIFLLNFIPSANALSIGISPSEKSIELEENKRGVVYFAISQGSKETESISISVDVNWLKPETESFDLGPMGQKYLKFTIDPLPAGNYTAKIKATTSITVAMKTSVTAKLVASVSPAGGVSELEKKARASESISKAQDMIKQARSAGGDTTDAENILTSALEEFDKGNYDSAKSLADSAYSLALSEYEKTKQSKIFLEPIKIAFIVIIIGTVVTLTVLIYEITISRSKRLLTKTARKCPKCGEKALQSYDGTFVSSYKCPKCGYSEVKEKTIFKQSH